jgi:hypothetical protein
MCCQFKSFELDRPFCVGFSEGDIYDDEALWEFIRDNTEYRSRDQLEIDDPNFDDVHYHEKELTNEDWDWVSERSEELRSEAIKKLKSDLVTEIKKL